MAFRILLLTAASPALLAVQDAGPEPLVIKGEVRTRGSLEARAAGDVAAFSIGMETFERNYASYDAVAPYVEPLGAGHARLMSGWAHIERTRGVYDFSELDRIVDDLRRKGVKPWVVLNYGNPALYGADAGGAQVEGKLPGGGEARRAWLRFVDRTVRRFAPGGRVVEWEIWNEPNASDAADTYGAFAAETARVILAAQPDAVLNVGAFSGSASLDWARAAVDRFARDSGAPPAQVKVTYHPYDDNPDASYDAEFEALRRHVEGRGYRLRQGENGAPSARQNPYALRNIDWTEDGQAKYALRRMVGDFARGIQSGIFTLMETHYPSGVGWMGGKGFWNKNSKGLLQTGPYHGRPPTYGDHRVVRAKTGYRAVQSLFAILDRRVAPDPEARCVAPPGYTAFAFRRDDGGRMRRMLAVWRHRDRPGEAARSEPVSIRCGSLPVGDPGRAGVGGVELTNPLTGTVYDIRADSGMIGRDGDRLELRGLPVGDTPLFIHDGGFVPIA